MDSKLISFNCNRPFGVEIETNSSDQRDFRANPLSGREMPAGIEFVGWLISNRLKTQAKIEKWHLTHNNAGWVLKPDRSCGIEICSPVSQGTLGLQRICAVVQALSKEKQVIADERCGLHVHVGLEDLNTSERGAVLAHWVKCESLFLDSTPAGRKRNRYCQQIGLSPMFEHNNNYTPAMLLSLLGSMKYYTMNAYHLNRGNRATIEFRIIEGAGCLDPYLIKNWVRLCVHFVDRAKTVGMPPEYNGTPKSGLLWLDPVEVFQFLGFFDKLSKGMEETRNWFLSRIRKNMPCNLPGVWSARSVARDQVEDMAKQFGLPDPDEVLKPTDLNKALYHTDFKV